MFPPLFAAKSDRIAGIMRHGERVHLDVANVESVAGAEDAPVEFGLQQALQRVLGQPIAVNRNLQLRAQNRQTLNVIGMFVRDQNPVQTLRRPADAGQPLTDLPGAKTGIDKNPGLIRLHIGGIAAGAAAENGQLNRHRRHSRKAGRQEQCF